MLSAGTKRAIVTEETRKNIFFLRKFSEASAEENFRRKKIFFLVSEVTNSISEEKTTSPRNFLRKRWLSNFPWPFLRIPNHDLEVGGFKFPYFIVFLNTLILDGINYLLHMIVFFWNDAHHIDSTESIELTLSNLFSRINLIYWLDPF